MQSYRRNFQFRQVKYMLLNVNVDCDRSKQWRKLSNCSHQVFVTKRTDQQSAFFCYIFKKSWFKIIQFEIGFHSPPPYLGGMSNLSLLCGWWQGPWREFCLGVVEMSTFNFLTWNSIFHLSEHHKYFS